MTLAISSPDLRPSLVGPLRGLAASGVLERVVTTLAFSRDGAALELAQRWTPQLAALMRRRVIPEGLDAIVECVPFGELLVQASGRMGFGDVARHRVWLWGEPYFDRQVARRLGGRTEVLYGHEHASQVSFETQKRAGGRCMLRQVSGHCRFTDEILDQEHERFGANATPIRRAILDSRARVNARKLAEYELADLIVANSRFVRRTFVESGVPASKIVVVPTGCPEPSASPQTPAAARTLVVSAGNLSLNKGTLYLIEAWRRLGLRHAKTELAIAGRNMLPPHALADLPVGVKLVGTLDAAALNRLYDQAAFFVLPTLYEGLAHVIPEALAHGVPVITTSHAGADDLIVDGVNGWIVPIRDSDALADRIAWCLEHPGELEAMRQQALETARATNLQQAVAAHVEIVRDFVARRTPARSPVRKMATSVADASCAGS